MGKRELLLIVAFIFTGTLLYQATAPPSRDGGFSWRNWIQNVRKNVGPRHEYLADVRTEALSLGRGTSEVRIAAVQNLSIIGTDGGEASAKIQVYSTGTDEQEARALGKRTVLKAATSGDILSLEMDYPPEERQRAIVVLTLPKTLRVRITRANNLEVTGVAGVEFDDTRGEATLKQVSGYIRGTHTGGELVFEGVEHVDMTARRTDLTIKNASGNVRLDLTGGQLMARDINGTVTLTANRTSIEIDRVLGQLTGDLTQGSLDVTRLTEPARVDARGTELRFDLAKPAAVTAMTTDENIAVRLPAGAGVTLDATVEDGEIRLPEGAPAPTTQNQSRIARGPFRGGGPTLALRTTHGDIVVR
jgi:hypothetical protein